MKLTAPFMSLGAHGTIKKAITFQENKGFNICRRRPLPTGPKTTCQINRRTVFNNGADTWKNHPELVPTVDQTAWNNLAKFTPMTGYNLFISRYLELNLVGCSIVSPAIIPTPYWPPIVTGYFLLVAIGSYLIQNGSGKIKLNS